LFNHLKDLFWTSEQSLELLDQDSYDALLTDIRMPNMDGLTLLEHVAKRRPEMKRLAMTGSLTLEIERRLTETKLDRELIRKPFTPVMLQEAMRHCF
jgi:DNA-binding NtrC family response regulator